MGRESSASRPLRVVLVAGHPVFGSTEAYVQALAASLDPARCTATVLHADVSALAPLSAIPGIRAVPVPLAWLQRSTPRTLRALARTLRGLAPDIVHVNDRLYPAVLAARVARVPGIVLTHHTPEHRLALGWRGRLAQRLALRCVDQFIVSTPQNRDTALRLDSLAPERLSVLALGVDHVRFSPRAPGAARAYLSRWGVGDKRWVLGTAARLEPQKAQLDLVRAAASVCRDFPEALFMVAGEGSERPALEAEIQRLGLHDRVLLPGFVDDMPAFLRELDGFVLTSRFEGLPWALLEAAATGLPLVATRVGGVPELVEDGVTGLLIAPGAPAALATALGSLHARPGWAAEMGYAARRRVLERFTIPVMARATERVDEKIAENRHGG
jgi:glycosyltransferase involved in cell wall biosynthesis